MGFFFVWGFCRVRRVLLSAYAALSRPTPTYADLRLTYAGLRWPAPSYGQTPAVDPLPRQQTKKRQRYALPLSFIKRIKSDKRL